MPILYKQRGNDNQQHENDQNRPFVNAFLHHAFTNAEVANYFFLSVFISDSSITGAGPEMPPSFRMRQKCTAIKIDATNGIPMQCQMYDLSNAFESTIEPP